MKKRIIASLLVVMMLLSLFPTSVLAAETTQTLTGEIFRLEKLDTGKTLEFDSIVTANYLAPVTDAALWYFCPDGTSSNTNSNAKGKIFTKIADGWYYYLGVDTSGSEPVLIGIYGDSESESYNAYHAKEKKAPEGAVVFTVKAETSGVGTITCSVNNETYYVTGKGNQLSTTSTSVYLTGNIGEPYLSGFGQGTASGTAIQKDEQRSIYILEKTTGVDDAIKNSEPIETNAVSVSYTAKTAAEAKGKTAVIDSRSFYYNSKYDPETATSDVRVGRVSRYYAMPNDPDEIALPLELDNGVIISLGNAAIWKFKGTTAKFTLARRDLTSSNMVTSENSSAKGYHNWRLKLAGGTNWMIVDDSTKAVKLSGEPNGNGFTFNKHDTNRFGFGSTTNTGLYIAIGIYKGYSQSCTVTDVSELMDGLVHLPTVGTPVAPSTNPWPENVSNLVIRYSMDGETWYSENDAKAATSVFPVEASATKYPVYVGIFYQRTNGVLQLLNQVTANVEIKNGSYTITYMDGETGLTNLTPTTYTFGTGATLPTTVEKTGYTFKGWYKEDGLTNSVSAISADEIGNKTFYAKFEANNIPVNFKTPSNEGPKDEQKNGKYGKTLTAIYALNGTMENPGSWAVVTNGYQTTLTAETTVGNPTANDGYTFIGWNSEVDAEGNVTLTAQYDPIVTYPGPNNDPEKTPIKKGAKLTLNLAGGEFDSSTAGAMTDWTYTSTKEPKTATKTINTPEDVSSYVPTYSGWEFLYWGDKSVDGEGNITLTAQYRPTVTYPNTDPNNPVVQPIDSGKTLTLILNGGAFETDTKTTMTANDWSHTATASTKKIETPEDISTYKPVYGGKDFLYWGDQTIDNNGNMTLTAQYSSNSYTITYMDGETGLSGLTPTTYTFGTGATLPTTVSKTGYTFKGWYKEAGLTNIVSAISTTEYGNKTFYAKFEANNIPVNFKTPSDEGPKDEQKNGKYGKTLTAIYAPNGMMENPGSWAVVTNGYQTTLTTETTVGNPTANDGYTFIGWNSEVDAEGNVTLTAQYDPIVTYPGPNNDPKETPIKKGARLTLELEGGAFENEQTLVNAGWTKDGEDFWKIIEAPENLMGYVPVKEDAEFQGWSTPREDPNHENGLILTALYDPSITYPSGPVEGPGKYPEEQKKLDKGTKLILDLVGGDFAADDANDLKNNKNWQQNGDKYNKTINVPEDIVKYIPEKDGFVFNGWTDPEPFGDGMIQKAQWLKDDDKNGVPDQYEITVTFKVVGTTWTDQSKEAKSVKVALFDEEDKWSTDGIGHLTADQIPAAAASKGEWDTSFSVATDLTEDKEYTYYSKLTVTYVPNGGTFDIPQVGEQTTDYSEAVLYGNKATEILTTGINVPTIAKGTDKFAGWYLDEELTNSWQFETGITEDITLYARWVKTLCTVTIKVQNADTPEFLPGATVILKSGENVVGTGIDNGDGTYTIENVAADIYTVEVTLGERGAASVITVTGDMEEVVKLPTKEIIVTYEKENPETRDTTISENLNNLAEKPELQPAVNGRVEIIMGIGAVDKGDPDFAEEIDSIETYRAGKGDEGAVEFINIDITRNNYPDKTQPDHTTTKITDTQGNVLAILIKYPTEATKTYRVYRNHEYTPGVITTEEFTEVELSDEMAKTGTGAVDKTFSVYVGENPGDGYIVVYSSLFSVYAISSIDTAYTVTYVPNGGTFDIPNAGKQTTNYSEEVLKGNKATEILTTGTNVPTIAKSGYKFAGWYLDKELTNSWQFETGITEDITLYARWVKDLCTLTIKVQDYNNPVYLPGATVVLKSGENIVGVGIDNGDGTYTIENVAADIYTVEVTLDDRGAASVITVTSDMEEVVKLPEKEIIVTYEKKNPETRDTNISENLGELAEEPAYQPEINGRVEIIMGIGAVDKNDTEYEEEIDSVETFRAGKGDSGTVEYVDIDITRNNYPDKTQPDHTTSKITDTQGNVLAILIKYPTEANKIYRVYRNHEYTPGVITTEEFTEVELNDEMAKTGAGAVDKTFSVYVGENPGDGYIVVYSSLFSIYAISYTDIVTPAPAPISDPVYKIKTETPAHGGLESSKTESAAGKTITLTLTPDYHYKLLSLTVTDEGGNSIALTKVSDTEYTFVMPASAVKVKATYKLDTGVWRWLDTNNHVAYISGYPDSSVRPFGNITRAETAMMFYRLLLNKDVEITKTFTDVNGDEWYATAVATLASMDIIRGYEDDTFRANQSITRAEFTAIAMRFAYAINGTKTFIDVPDGYWAEEWIASAATYGWIEGYDDNTFRPTGDITRAEAATIINRMLERSADEEYVDEHEAELKQFTDLKDSSLWYYYEMQEACNEHKYSIALADGKEYWNR